MLKIVLNEDKEIVDMVRQGLKDNDGHCPCVISAFWSDKTKCICEPFRNQQEEGYCHCKLYRKVEVK